MILLPEMRMDRVDLVITRSFFQGGGKGGMQKCKQKA
jgi:hypothetical protein